MPDQNQILLQTKLHKPRLPNNLLQRTRLVELLNHNIDRQLILVCAPAGFGKTTLVSTWLERMAAGKGEQATSLTSAWLSLDENDSDLNQFIRYIIAALRTIFADAWAENMKAAITECECGTAGRTLPHGRTSLTPNWSGFPLKWSLKHFVIPWSYDLDPEQMQERLPG